MFLMNKSSNIFYWPPLSCNLHEFCLCIVNSMILMETYLKVLISIEGPLPLHPFELSQKGSQIAIYVIHTFDFRIFFAVDILSVVKHGLKWTSFRIPNLIGAHVETFHGGW